MGGAPAVMRRSASGCWDGGLRRRCRRDPQKTREPASAPAPPVCAPPAESPQVDNRKCPALGAVGDGLLCLEPRSDGRRAAGVVTTDLGSGCCMRCSLSLTRPASHSSAAAVAALRRAARCSGSCHGDSLAQGYRGAPSALKCELQGCPDRLCPFGLGESPAAAWIQCTGQPLGQPTVTSTSASTSPGTLGERIKK